MEFKTIDYWDEALWGKVFPIYEVAFAEKGAKPEKIVRNMFRKKLCFLHVGFLDNQAAVMAISGKLGRISALLIDYLAVQEAFQNQGIGNNMITYVKEWAAQEGQYESLVIEVESDLTPENLARIRFWEKCGFTITDYIHHYIWVPEPYRAMFLKLVHGTALPESGEEIFKYIGVFHKKSFTGS
ncbi:MULTISPECIES: GNAT family N-acetyltransferase [Neobacillus]|uniref:GNAT family N-acetyltransferase n=1 Tax=Neobacillus rhizophilus TaxID=2833579 RepID=A0A942U1R5_9BACI|nr:MULTISPECIES: GNAT family N-acetyltransferase [Neobacillus]MBS4211192.1 GNAT family N-acetyltransferase [Neobacillus rhizophilus]MBU8918716.1 GNAT family N-acetyltransferase [Bacillus sp. FJAT-29953]